MTKEKKSDEKIIKFSLYIFLFVSFSLSLKRKKKRKIRIQIPKKITYCMRCGYFGVDLDQIQPPTKFISTWDLIC